MIMMETLGVTASYYFPFLYTLKCNFLAALLSRAVPGRIQRSCLDVMDCETDNVKKIVPLYHKYCENNLQNRIVVGG